MEIENRRRVHPCTLGLIGIRNGEVDRVRAVPLPRGQGWEDLEYTVSEWSKTFPKYAYGDPSKPPSTVVNRNILGTSYAGTVKLLGWEDLAATSSSPGDPFQANSLACSDLRTHTWGMSPTEKFHRARVTCAKDVTIHHSGRCTARAAPSLSALNMTSGGFV
jgi:hypothetical protein